MSFLYFSPRMMTNKKKIYIYCRCEKLERSRTFQESIPTGNCVCMRVCVCKYIHSFNGSLYRNRYRRYSHSIRDWRETERNPTQRSRRSTRSRRARKASLCKVLQKTGLPRDTWRRSRETSTARMELTNRREAYIPNGNGVTRTLPVEKFALASDDR